jgi:hypothetical protein
MHQVINFLSVLLIHIKHRYKEWLNVYGIRRQRHPASGRVWVSVESVLFCYKTYIKAADSLVQPTDISGRSVLVLLLCHWNRALKWSRFCC